MPITNSFLSDLLPGFNLSLTHDLWRGQVGTDTASFDPFLQNVSASFAISGNTLRAVGSIFGLGGKAKERGREEIIPPYVAHVADGVSAPGMLLQHQRRAARDQPDLLRRASTTR